MSDVQNRPTCMRIQLDNLAGLETSEPLVGLPRLAPGPDSQLAAPAIDTLCSFRPYGLQTQKDLLSPFTENVCQPPVNEMEQNPELDPQMHGQLTFNIASNHRERRKESQPGAGLFGKK